MPLSPLSSPRIRIEPRYKPDLNGSATGLDRVSIGFTSGLAVMASVGNEDVTPKIALGWGPHAAGVVLSAEENGTFFGREKIAIDLLFTSIRGGKVKESEKPCLPPSNARRRKQAREWSLQT